MNTLNACLIFSKQPFPKTGFFQKQDSRLRRIPTSEPADLFYATYVEPIVEKEARSIQNDPRGQPR